MVLCNWTVVTSNLLKGKTMGTKDVSQAGGVKPDELDLALGGQIEKIRGIVEGEINRRLHEFLQVRMSEHQYLFCVLGSGTTFDVGKDEFGRAVLLIYVLGQMVERFFPVFDKGNKVLGDALQELFLEEERPSTWKFVWDSAICQVGKELFPPPPEVEDENDGRGEGGSVVSAVPRPKPKPRKRFGQFSPSRPTLECFVQGTSRRNEGTLIACFNATKPSEEESAVKKLRLLGPRNVGKGLLLRAIAGSIWAQNPKKRISFTTGEALKDEYGFRCYFRKPGGSLGCDEERLKRLREDLYDAKVLIVEGLEQIGLTAPGTQKFLAKAIRTVLENGGRVFVSVSTGPLNPTGFETMIEELREVVKSLTGHWVDEVGKEELAFGLSHCLFASFSPRSEGQDFPLSANVVKAIAGIFPREELNDQLWRALLHQRSHGKLEVLDVRRMNPTGFDIDVLVGLVSGVLPDIFGEDLELLYEGPFGDDPFGAEKLQGLPSTREVVTIRAMVAFLACEIAGISEERVASWIYPPCGRGEFDLKTGVRLIKGHLKKDSDALDQITPVLEDMLECFVLPLDARKRAERLLLSNVPKVVD